MDPIIIVLISLVGVITIGNCQETFKNPILDRNSADPSAIRLGDHYYLTLSENVETEITIFKSSRLTDFRNAEKYVAYTAKDSQGNLWASEMHLVNGELYIYFCMDGYGKDHRMYALKADDETNPFGNWSDAIRLMPDWDYGAIDGTVMRHGGQLYFVWASTAFNNPLSLYIAEMEDPLTIGVSKVFLRGPKSDWEIQGGPTNEGPYFIYKNNVSYLIFSASSTWEPDYCLGLMSIPDHLNPMETSNWDYGEDHPVFWRNDQEQIYTTGHAAFTVSPDGSETWMIYHASNSTEFINGNRVARIAKIEWDDNGVPIFPRPTVQPQSVPSGQL